MTKLFLFFFLLLGVQAVSAQSSVDSVVVNTAFQDSLIFNFKTTCTATLTIKLYDRWGRVIATVCNAEVLPAGAYAKRYDGGDTLADGPYLYVIKSSCDGVNVDTKTGRSNKFTTSGVAEAKASSYFPLNLFKLFPNPVKDELHLNNLPFDKGTIEIITLQGRRVMLLHIDAEKEYVISVADLLAQPYILKIQAPGSEKPSSKVFVKE